MSHGDDLASCSGNDGFAGVRIWDWNGLAHTDRTGCLKIPLSESQGVSTKPCGAPMDQDFRVRMNIDWFTFVAQIVNFLVLVGLLRWLLYGPIIRAMTEREQKIKSRLDEAEQRRDHSEQKLQEYTEKIREFERERDAMFAVARQDAHEEHQRLIRESRDDAQHRHQQWQKAYRREQEDLLAELRRQAGEMGILAARYTLAHLADATLERQMCQKFTLQLKNLDEQQRQETRRHLRDGQGEILLFSAFPLDHRLRDELSHLVQSTFDTQDEVAFEQSPELICGLELNVGGYSFGWNIREFLHDLQLDFAEGLKSDITHGEDTDG